MSYDDTPQASASPPVEKDTTTTEDGPVEIRPGLTFERLRDGAIIAFTITEMSRDMIDAWANSAVSHLNEWPTGKPFLNLQDFSQIESFTITPYFRERVKDITGPRPEINGRTAVIVPRNFTMHVVRMFTRLLPSMGRSSRERDIFFEREKGMAWLEEMLDDSETA